MSHSLFEELGTRTVKDFAEGVVDVAEDRDKVTEADASEGHVQELRTRVRK